jgi:hypothetical protein
LFGTPAQVVERIEELCEALDLAAWSGIPHDLTMRSMRLFADKVLPWIRGTVSHIVRAAK